MTREIMDMAQDAGWDAHHAEFDTRIEAFATLVREEQQTEVQRLIALVRAQQITIDKLEAALAQPEQEPDYAWQTVADYEKDVGFQVGEAFKMAWSMARTTNALFKEMENT
jgi:hypothetical protein